MTSSSRDEVLRTPDAVVAGTSTRALGHRRARLAARMVWTCLAALAFCVVLPRASVGATTAPSEVPDGFVAPRVLREVEITYPEDLAETDDPPGGTIVVKYTVGTDGVPHALAIERPVHPQLDALALDAVSRLRYAPATVDGQPVEVILRLSLQLTPPEPEPAPDPARDPDPARAVDPPGADDAASPAPPSPPLGRAALGGEILEAGQRTPVSGASVVLVPAGADARLGEVKKKDYGEQPEPAWTRQAISAADGKFSAAELPSGRLRVVILAPGYERLEFVEALDGDQRLEVRYYLRRLPDNPYRTVVRTERARREEVTRRTVTVEEIRALPGTQGDALKAVQNFPGIARAPFGIGLFAIRGSDPTDSAVYLGEHEIPQLFHFGGLTSVFNADVISHIDYIPGNFDSRFGDATGGIIDVTPRAGRRDGFHGYVDSDLFDTGVLLEGPVGKGSFVLSGRRSYIDLLLPAVLPADAGLDLAIAPRYYDYQALLDQPVGQGNLTVRFFGSDDRARLVTSAPNEVSTDDRNRFETAILFHRADLQYENHRRGWDFLITPSYKYDSFQGGAGDVFRFRIASHTFSARAEVGRRISRRLRWDIGTQVLAGTFTIDATAPAIPTDGTGSVESLRSTSSKDAFAIPGLHGTLSWRVTDKLTLYPGLRVNHYAVLFERATVDPRLRFGWAVADRTTIRGGVGLYSQVPSPPEWNRTWGNPGLAPERAVHVSGSVGHEFPHGIWLEVTGFYKYLWDDATQSSRVVVRHDGQIGPESFASQGLGRMFGGELFLRKDLTRNLFGWLSYTLSRSERREAPGEPWRLFSLDQPHILTFIGVYRLPKNWQVGARFRVVSGNPYTPIIGGIYDAGGGGPFGNSYIPVSGETNSDRVATFHQLDLRVDRRFVWRRVMLTIYVDVQNVYNRQNAEFVQYSYDYGAFQPIPSLPIIPSFGARLEF
jgi:hypothetical protein